MGVARLLAVEDQPALREVMCRYLVRTGFDVETAGSGEEAWALIEPDPHRFGAFLIDLTLPDISGAELAERLLAVHPKAGIILTSGNPFEVGEIAPANARVIFIQKPFASKRLLDELRNLLGP